MARVPGTEAPRNDAGWRPGAVVRCRRSRANADLGLADRQGLAIEVRSAHVRVLVEATGRSVWLESAQLLPHPALDDQDLARIAEVFTALRGHRLEAEDDELVIFSEAFDAKAVERVALLDPGLAACRIEARGVHEVGIRLPNPCSSDGPSAD